MLDCEVVEVGGQRGAVVVQERVAAGLQPMRSAYGVGLWLVPDRLDLEHVPPEHVRAEDVEIEPPLEAVQVLLCGEVAGGLVVLHPDTFQSVHLPGHADRTILLGAAKFADARQIDLAVTQQEGVAVGLQPVVVAGLGQLHRLVEGGAGQHGLGRLEGREALHRRLRLVVCQPPLAERLDVGDADQHHAASSCAWTYLPAVLSKSRPLALAALANNCWIGRGWLLMSANLPLKSSAVSSSSMASRHCSSRSAASRWASVCALSAALVSAMMVARKSRGTGLGISMMPNPAGFLPKADSVGSKFRTRLPLRMYTRPIASTDL